MDMDNDVIFTELVNYFVNEVKALNCATIEREESINSVLNIYSNHIHVMIVER